MALRRMARKRIGELLVERALITPAQLEEGLAHQRQTRQRLGVALIQKGFLSEEQLAHALADALGIPLVDLKATQPEWSAIHMLRAQFCEQHDLFPFAMTAAGSGGSGEKAKPGGKAQPRKQLLVAMSDPLNVPAIEEIEFTTGLKVAPRLAPLSAVRGAIARYYHKVNPDQAVGDTVMVIHSKAGGGSVSLSREGTAAPDEDIIEGELLEGVEPVPADDLDDLFSAATPGKAPAPPVLAPAAAKRSTPVDHLRSDLDYLFGSKEAPDPVERLELKFWTLLRLMADKGLITREEFAKALAEAEDGT